MPASLHRFLLATWIALASSGSALAQCDTIELERSDGTPEDEFGRELAVSGDTAIVGAMGDDPAGVSTGSAYVFERISGEWVLIQKLVSADLEHGDNFGFSVAMDGDVAVVGTERGDGAASNSGNAYVFERTNGQWV